MEFEINWLDQLTACILAVTDAGRNLNPINDWLGIVADAICAAFGGQIGVAIIRVAPGDQEAPWRNSIHTVRVGNADDAAEWRERYTMATVAAGLTPQDLIEEVSEQAQAVRICPEYGAADPSAPRQAQMAHRFMNRCSLRDFIHTASLIPNGHDSIQSGAVVMDVWLLPTSDAERLPPPQFFRNIVLVIRDTLMRREFYSATSGGSLLESLTEKQQQVAALLMEGLSEKQIAERLDRSHHTVHQHVKAIYSTIGVRSRAEFMARCLPVMNSHAAELMPLASG